MYCPKVVAEEYRAYRRALLPVFFTPRSKYRGMEASPARSQGVEPMPRSPGGTDGRGRADAGDGRARPAGVGAPAGRPGAAGAGMDVIGVDRAGGRGALGDVGGRARVAGAVTAAGGPGEAPAGMGAAGVGCVGGRGVFLGQAPPVRFGMARSGAVAGVSDAGGRGCRSRRGVRGADARGRGRGVSAGSVMGCSGGVGRAPRAPPLGRA
jgi:hypothetical protein